MIDPDQSTLREAWMAIAQLEQLRGDVAELAKNIGLAADTAPLLVFGAARNIISSFRIYHPEHAAAELRLAVTSLTPKAVDQWTRMAREDEQAMIKTFGTLWEPRHD